MRKIRHKDTKPEMLLRKLVHGMGYRYRLHHKGLPGKPDLVFGPRRKVIFVHGCFWHQHPDPECKLVHRPKSNLGYWQNKLLRNQERDAANLIRLDELGWEAMVFWECEVKSGDGIAAKIKSFLAED